MNRLQIELDIEGIERLCDRATSGNVSHVIGTIKSYCQMIKEELDVPDWSHYRNKAAIAAMQELIDKCSVITDKTYKMVAKGAVEQADALIEELKKNNYGND